VNRDTDISAWALQQTGGNGVNMVLDHVGPALWEASLFALATQGRLVTCGNTTGDTATIPSLGFVFQRGIQIRGSDAYFSTDFNKVWQQYCEGIGDGSFHPAIYRHYPIAEGALAQDALESGEAMGRLVLHHGD
jgi:NADPH:quinone reductase-like Zn-dependent oxidoreductase